MTAAAVFVVPAAIAAEIDTSALTRAVTATGIGKHLEAFQRIADRHGGNRAAGTAGYQASVDYVSKKLEAAGYDVTIQPFEVDFFQQLSRPRLVRTAPSRKAYKFGKDFLTMEYSGDGTIDAELALAGGIQIPPSPEPSSTSGCRPKDFPASVAGKIVLVQRGGCDFAVKVANANAAGAVGVLIFNEGQPGRRVAVNGTLGGPADIPAIGTSFRVGEGLYKLTQKGPVRMRLVVDAEIHRIETSNVIAEWRGPRNGRAVVVGAHLDSVPQGPGINDNGSGSATILEIALQMKRLNIKPRNTLRFAFWGAEEEGLFGSTHYVESLSEGARARIMANLNFDMLASPNFVRFVYDGDGSIGPEGPPGSAEIEHIFERYFSSKDLATEPTLFDGRSDYLAFIQAGIPAGGLFSGAEEIKTKEQAKIFGGTAGEAYDACYHLACDDIPNISKKALNQFGKAAADAVMNLARRPDDIRPSGGEAGAESASAAATAAIYRGRHLVR